MNIKIFRKRKNHVRCSAAGLFFLALALMILPCRATVASAAQPAAEEAMTLSLNDAIARALENNLMMKLSQERIEETKGLRMQGRADFLPHVSVNVSQDRVFWENLAAEGLSSFGVLGPFNSFDARVQLIQRVFDLSALSGFRAKDASLKIAYLEEGFARQQVILSAVFSYLNVLNKEEELRAVEQDINLAQQVVTMAEHQLSAGIVTNLDVIRAKTRLAQQQAHRQDVLQSLCLAHFQLMRTTGLPLESSVRLTDSLHFFKEEALPVADAIDIAFKDRIEMSLAKEKIRYQEYKLSEAKNERLPELDVYGNYGLAGETSVKSTNKVAGIGVKFTMPAFEGGEINGRILEQRSLKQSEEFKRDDVEVQVEEDVRLALQTLVTSTDRVNAAKEAFDLAKREVELAQNQYRAGTQDNIAVVEAQVVLARAHEAYITAVTQYHLARVNYFSALGRTESFHLNAAIEEG